MTPSPLPRRGSQGKEAWLKLTHFFATLFLIHFAIGVATGLVQEFQFGMNWSVYSKSKPPPDTGRAPARSWLVVPGGDVLGFRFAIG